MDDFLSDAHSMVMSCCVCSLLIELCKNNYIFCTAKPRVDLSEVDELIKKAKKVFLYDEQKDKGLFVCLFVYFLYVC